ncbi:hypothetical protein [Rhizobium sp. A37_96]
MDQRAKRDAGDFLPKYLDILTKFSTLAATVTFLFGSSFLFGRCLGIGYRSFQYMTISDVISSSFACTPIVISYFSLIVLLIIVTHPVDGTPTANNKGLSDSSFSKPIGWLTSWPLLFLYLLIGVANILFFPPEFGTGFAALFFLLFILSLCIRAVMKSEELGLPSAVAYFSLGCGTCAILLGAGYFINSAIINNPKFENIGEEMSICTDICKHGQVVTRFSEVTVVRWSGTMAVSYLANTSIKQIDELHARDDQALIDVPKVIRNAIAWLAAGS